MARSSASALHRQFSTHALCGNVDDVQGMLPLVSKDTIDHALGLAAYEGHIDLVDILLPHSDPAHNEYRPLVLAAMNGKLHTVLQLLPYGMHQRVIVEAARSGHPEIVEAVCAHATRKQIVQARGVARRMKWEGLGVARLMEWCAQQGW